MAGSAQPLGAESGARRYQLFINGKFVDSRSGKRFESISPHDRAVVAVVAEGDKADIDAAVAAARAAYEGTWTTTPAGERARVLNKIAICSRRTPPSSAASRRSTWACRSS